MSHIYEYETWAVCHSVKSLIVFRRHYSSLSFCSSRIPHSLHCYTLKLSAAVQNRSPTPAICPSYANPVVSMSPNNCQLISDLATPCFLRISIHLLVEIVNFQQFYGSLPYLLRKKTWRSTTFVRLEFGLNTHCCGLTAQILRNN